MADEYHLELTDPAKATTLWMAIDHQLTSNAVWVPTVNERGVEFVSKRLRNYEYNPVWGFLPQQSSLGPRLPRPSRGIQTTPQIKLFGAARRHSAD